MYKILFVCHGNICRSPMAEFVMKDLVEKSGLEDRFYIESAATSTEEIGNDMYPEARLKLADKGIDAPCRGARQIRPEDYGAYDFIIGMDEENRYNLKRYFSPDPNNKVSLLLDFTDEPHAIADPWYTNEFDTTYKEIVAGCQGLLAHLIS